MLERIVESFFSKIGEQLMDYAHNNMSKINESHSSLNSLRENVLLLSAIKSDVDVQIRNAEQSGNRKRKRQVENWLMEAQMIENEFMELDNEVQSEGFVGWFLGGDKVAKLNERVDKLVEQSRHFGGLVLDPYETQGEPLLTARLIGDDFEKKLERIWKMLATDKVLSIGIYGMGGVGKTALTKHIHNWLIENTQERVFWVTVSQDFSVKMLQDEIARVIRVDLSDKHDEDKRAARLNASLRFFKKNVVLILDDVWKYINLEKVGDPLRVEGCRLIITTRSLKVCQQMRCQKIVEVKTLRPNDAWNLFRQTLGRETKMIPQVQDIAKSMVKICDGLPLGIIALAESMRGETAIHAWRNELAELRKSVMGQDDMEDKVLRVLKYSFDRLDPSHQGQGKSNGCTTLQLCFLYCSLYPENYKIKREEIIREFISEGLVDKRKSRKAQIDEAHSALDKLVSVCLLESAHVYKDGDGVKMHNLVRAMALKITRGKNMVLAGYYTLKEIPTEEEWTIDLEKMSLMENAIEELPNGKSPNCPKLSTLLLKRNPLKFLPDSFFPRMHGLCNLDLSETKIKELPNSLSDLQRLKALILRKCENLVHVPYLGNLKSLLELDLSFTPIKQVPQGMEKLVNLNILSMEGMSFLELLLPEGLLLNFPRIQCIRLPVQIEAPVEEIERLKELEEFEGRVKDVRSFNRFVRATQSRVRDTCYKIQIGSSSNNGRSYSGDYNGVIFRQHGLKEKEVTVLAHDIHHLDLLECEGLSNSLLDDFARLNNPTALKSLRIIKCKGIESIVMDSDELLESQFQTLKVIELEKLPDFMSVIYNWKAQAATILPSPRQAVFSSLRRLIIFGCNKMKKLGLPVSECPNLEKISVRRCLEIEEIISDDYTGRVREGEALVSLPKLKCLRLVGLPRLKSLCKSPMICSSIESITIWGCRALKKVPILHFPASTGVDFPTALREIWIRPSEKEWWESLEWDNPTHSHLLQPFIKLY